MTGSLPQHLPFLQPPLQPRLQPALQQQKGLLKLGLPKGLLKMHASTVMQLHRIVDPLVVALLLPGITLHRGQPWSYHYIMLEAIAALLMLLLGPISGIYRSLRMDPGPLLLRRVLVLWLSLLGSLSALLFLMKSGSLYSRELLLLWAASSGAWLVLSHVASRSLLRRLREVGHNSRLDGYVGTAEGYQRLGREIEANPWLGQRLHPLMTWHEDQLPDLEQVEARMLNYLEILSPNQWLIDDCGSPALMRRILELLEEQNQPVVMVPHWMSSTSYRPKPCQLGELPAMMLWHVDHASPQRLLKGAADVVAALLMLIVLSPLLAAISLAVRLDSPGPVLFLQRRYGLNGKPFQCFKFRTMRVQENDAVVLQATREDPRVTPVGRLLRSWNIDELPQLLNVLRGEMSLVGPRPHAAVHNEFYRQRVSSYMRRHALRPGITGWAQVNGLRGETSTIDLMERRVQADINYIHNWTLALDFKILFLTLLRWSSPQAY